MAISLLDPLVQQQVAILSQAPGIGKLYNQSQVQLPPET